MVESFELPAREPDHLFAVRLMEHLVIPTFVLDAGGRVLIWNRACERLTGLPASDVVGTDGHWRGFYEARRPCLADLVLSGAQDGIEKLYAEHVRNGSGQIGLSAENWCGMPNVGSTRYLAIDAGPIFGDRGELLAVVETLRDITAQHEAQVALQTLASSDGLTELANRRVFNQILEQECGRARRAELPLSLLMIDIDHFKAYNDALGHQAGDDCLKRCAAAIKAQMLRPGDLAARYGGEEFVALLPNTPLTGAVTMAKRLQARLAAAKIPHPASPTASFVTASVGAACCTWACEEPSLVAAADAALYEAKRAGRNRVVAARAVVAQARKASPRRVA